MDEAYIKEITDKANEKINRICPLLHEDVKTYMVRYILEVLEEMKKK